MKSIQISKYIMNYSIGLTVNQSICKWERDIILFYDQRVISLNIYTRFYNKFDSDMTKD